MNIVSATYFVHYVYQNLKLKLSRVQPIQVTFF